MQDAGILSKRLGFFRVRCLQIRDQFLKRLPNLFGLRCCLLLETTEGFITEDCVGHVTLLAPENEISRFEDFPAPLGVRKSILDNLKTGGLPVLIYF